MATGYIIWDRRQKTVVSPPNGGVYTTQADADAALARLNRKSGPLGRNHQNLERTTVNVD